MTKTYSFNDFAGCVSIKRSRQTGTLVGVYNAEQAGLDNDDGRAPWSTVCEKHGTIICHSTLSLAKGHAADPKGWCEDCR